VTKKDERETFLRSGDDVRLGTVSAEWPNDNVPGVPMRRRLGRRQGHPFGGAACAATASAVPPARGATGVRSRHSRVR